MLVIFGNIPLLGQERGNIQAMNAVKAGGMDTLFVTHNEYGHEVIQPTLDELGHAWTVATYPGLLSQGMSLGQWKERLTSIARGVWEFIQIARAYGPTHIHVGNSTQFLGLLPALWLLRVPVIYRLGDAPQQHRPLFRFLWRHVIIPNVDQFVCVSEYIRKLLIEAGASSEQVRVIYSYPSKRTADRMPVALPPFEGRTVVYMGQLTEDKGVDLLVESAIEICRTSDDVRFLVAGDYTWQNPFAEALIERVESLNLSNRIQFLGFVEDVPGLLTAADVHVCPSVWEEPLSNTVVEAKRSGTPSIVFPSGGLPELIEHDMDGWICEAKTKASLRHALDQLLSRSDASLRAMGREAEASMQRLGITPKAFTDAWVEVYQQAALSSAH